MFKWLDTTSVDALADSLVADLLQRVPPAALGAAGKKAGAKHEKAYKSVLSKAREFKRDHDLNVYKKARLANRLKWALAEAGYPPEFVTELTYELAATLSSHATGDR